MAYDKASAAYVERVLCGVVTREGGRRNTIRSILPATTWKGTRNAKRKIPAIAVK